MDGFYVSLVFLGVLLVIFSLICIFIDKRKVFNFTKNYEEKKQQLVEIINDAEQMINELNKFSDYIVNRIDLKNEELNKNLKLAEERLSNISNRTRMIYDKKEAVAIVEYRAEHGLADMEAASAEKTEALDTAQISYPASAVNGSTLKDDASASSAIPSVRTGCENIPVPLKKREKVIPINNKYPEVLRLSNEGVQSLEIAKRLNIGKGEVELVLGIRK